MSVNVPKDPFSIDSDGRIEPKTAETFQQVQPSVSTKDSLKNFSKEELSTRVTPQEKSAPELPKAEDNSIIATYRILTEAMRAFRNQLSASDKANLESRQKMSQLAVSQAIEFSEVLKQKAAAIAKLQEEISNNLGDLQKQLDEMRELLKKQQEGIDQINSGNGLEKQHYEELMRAYDDYIAQLKSIGAVDLGNGNFYIPEEPEKLKELYNQFTLEYQRAVAKFNDYFPGRLDQINKYNAATNAYNQKVAEYNKAVKEFINQHNLSDYIKENGILIPQLPPASQRDISSYKENLDSPSTISSTPAHISTYPPPHYARVIAQAGPSALPNLNSFSPFDAKILYLGMYHHLYASQIAPFDQEMMRYTNYWSFLIRKNIHDLDQTSSNDPLLNSKPIIQRLLPPSLLISKPSQTTSATASSLTMGAMQIDNPHLKAILGHILLKEALDKANLKSLEETLNQKEREIKINELADQILLLSIGLLGNQSMQALFPSLGILSDSLFTLPKDSPAFAILFSVSLSNRIQEDVKQGITSQALHSFLKENPELAALSKENKDNLTAAFNLGQLLVAGKLLEDNLGLQGLLAQILPESVSSLDFDQIIPQAMEENRQGNMELQIRVKDDFINQGYSEEKALFLARTCVELTQQGLLTPHLPSNISPKTINQPLLINSVKAALVMADYSLEEANTFAHEAINRTLTESPYPSIKQFRAALESHLTDLKVKTSSEIAIAAVVTLPPEKSLTPIASFSLSTGEPAITASLSGSITPETPSPTSGSKSIPPVSYPKLSHTEIASLLEKRSLQLLVPQLGFKLAQQINQEIAKTLFGTPHPDTHHAANIPSPYSLIEVIKNQLYHFNIEQNKNWVNAMTKTYKESIKTMESFYFFSLKLMDPAYLGVFASGIIYEDQGRKKAIDIPI